MHVRACAHDEGGSGMCHLVGKVGSLLSSLYGSWGLNLGLQVCVTKGLYFLRHVASAYLSFLNIFTYKCLSDCHCDFFLSLPRARVVGTHHHVQLLLKLFAFCWVFFCVQYGAYKLISTRQAPHHCAGCTLSPHKFFFNLEYLGENFKIHCV